MLDIETRRLKELSTYEILDTPTDGAFDDITALAADYFRTPIAIVSLVDRDRIWFKSAQGLGELRQINRGPGLCASAIMQDDCYIAEDLRNDPNSLANPLVARENGLRFYAASPIRSRNGFNLGTVCVIDTAPRIFTDEDARFLNRLSRLVSSEMEHRLASRQIAGLAEVIGKQNAFLAHAATHDPLTGLLNRGAAQRWLDKFRPRQAPQGSALLLDVDHFKMINDRYGHAAGDATLVEVAKRIKSNVRATDQVARYGGEEFLVILDRCPPAMAQSISERIRRSVQANPIQVGNDIIWITISGGLCHGVGCKSGDDMFRVADSSLYLAKNRGRNQIVVAA